MIFTILYKDQTTTSLSAATWSEATAYAEGTGKQIVSITEPVNPTLVLLSPASTNFYQLTLKNNTTGTSTPYFVFAEDYASLENWISTQTNFSVTMLMNSERNYVSL